jgi:uncharacterized protein (DUF427 family)
MTLTIGPQPLGSTGPRTVNYRLDGPKHRLLFDPFPRRVRAYLGGELVLDTRRGMLLHESNLMVQLYVPEDDVRAKLTLTDHTTHCPFKGDASYWTVTAGERTVENALWGYREPIAEASWLRGYVAVYWTAMDAWFDEDEETHAHLRDPYHRVDVRRTSQQVQVSAHGQPIAQTRRALLVSETGLPNRYYLPLHDVPAELLEVSPTHTYCPYKGRASYYTVAGVPDAAWYYPEPIEEMPRLRGHLAFHGEGIEVVVDGERVETGMPPRPANVQ